MRSLPRKAQLYIYCVYAGGVATALLARGYALRNWHIAAWEFSLFAVLALLAGGSKVRLMRHKSAEDVGSMSLGFVITFAALLRFGPPGAVVIGALGSLSGCTYPHKQANYQLVFNVALTAMASMAAGSAFMLLNHGTIRVQTPDCFPAVAGSSLVYFMVNTGGVAVIISLCMNLPVGKLWRQTFLWTAPTYFAAAGISTVAIILSGQQVGAILLFGAPVAYLTYQSYAVYTARAEEKQQHIEELQLSQAQLADLYLATIKSLALAIDAKDQYTHQHILRVQRYSVAVAVKMGLTGAELEGVNTGALLHDIGKLGVPEYVLLKPGRLTDEEFAKIKKHPEIGAAILDPVEFPWPVLPVVKYHHEKWDGSGYPEGLAGEAIPLTARILAVGDVYDALTSNRSYRNAWTHEKAVELIRTSAGTHFDPIVAEAFLEIIDGIVQEMAEEGCGPLVVQQTPAPGANSKADQAARDIQRASSELWALYEIAQTLSSSLGLQETLDILARKIEAILPGTACLFLLKHETEGLTVSAAVGVNREFFQGGRTVGPRSRSAQVAETQMTYMGEYDSDDLMLVSSPVVQWSSLNSALIVPVVHQGEVLGTVNLYHTDPNCFGAHDLQLLETIGERAAMAIYNGILFDRTRSHAVTDPLTELYNLRYLTSYVDIRCGGGPVPKQVGIELAEVAPGSDGTANVPVWTPDRADGDTSPFALLCMDLDSFKPINDNFGHQKGDEVLRDLSKLFRDTVREGDIVARYGGDEFLVVLQGAGPEQAELMANRIQKVVEEYDPGLMHPRLGALHLGVSVGFACFPADGRDCAGLLSCADSNMYRNKTERKLGLLAGGASSRAASGDSVPPIQHAA